MKGSLKSSVSDQYQIDDGKAKWYGQEVGVESGVPLKEDAAGPTKIVREFIFAFSPQARKHIKAGILPPPSSQSLFNAHVRQLEITLWTDGLEFDTEHSPAVVVGKKKYKIVVVCKPRPGNIFSFKDKPRLLQDITKPKTNSA